MGADANVDLDIDRIAANQPTGRMNQDVMADAITLWVKAF